MKSIVEDLEARTCYTVETRIFVAGKAEEQYHHTVQKTIGGGFAFYPLNDSTPLLYIGSDGGIYSDPRLKYCRAGGAEKFWSIYMKQGIIGYYHSMFNNSLFLQGYYPFDFPVIVYFPLQSCFQEVRSAPAYKELVSEDRITVEFNDDETKVTWNLFVDEDCKLRKATSELVLFRKLGAYGGREARVEMVFTDCEPELSEKRLSFDDLLKQHESEGYDITKVFEGRADVGEKLPPLKLKSGEVIDFSRSKDGLLVYAAPSYMIAYDDTARVISKLILEGKADSNKVIIIFRGKSIEKRKKGLMEVAEGLPEGVVYLDPEDVTADHIRTNNLTSFFVDKDGVITETILAVPTSTEQERMLSFVSNGQHDSVTETE